MSGRGPDPAERTSGAESSAGATGPAIDVRNLTIAFDELVALDDVTFSVQTGEMLVVTGTSGSGKSVLLHAVLGFLRADSGTVQVQGIDVGALDERHLLNLVSTSIGLVFQDDTLFSSLTTYDNTAFRLVEHGWKPRDVDRTVREILSFVGLDQDAQKLPEELSIGMRRRLEIARALAGWPPVMLFDEPTSGLDPLNAKRILDLLIRARDAHGISSLVVTKELHDIPYLADHVALPSTDGEIGVVPRTAGSAPRARVLLLKKGRIAFMGDVEAFFASHDPAVVEMTGTEDEDRSRRPER